MSTPEGDDLLREILGALEMPPGGLIQWFDHVERFCQRHGGERVYGDLLALIRKSRDLARESASDRKKES